MNPRTALTLVTLMLLAPLAGCLDSSSDTASDDDSSDLEATIADLNANVVALQTQLAHVTGGWASANSTVAALMLDADGHTATVVLLTSGWSNTNQTIIELEAGWADANQTAVDAALEVENMNATVAELQAAIEALTQQLEAASAGWAATNATIDLFTQGWADANLTVAALQQGWHEANATVQALEDAWNEANASTPVLRVPEFYGSWTDPIYSSNASRSNLFSCADEDGWKSVDAPKTVEVLSATKQNLYLMATAVPDGSVGSDCTWDNINRIHTEIDAQELSIQTAGVMADYHSLSEYLTIIQELKDVAGNHHEMSVVTVDDFNQALAKPTSLDGSGGLTVADVQTMADEAIGNLSAGQSPLGFAPYFNGNDLPVYYGQDTLIFGTVGCNGVCPLSNGQNGVDGDFYIFPEDELLLNATFATPTNAAGASANLSFLLHESLRTAPYTMDLVMEINGIEVGRHAMVDTPGNNKAINLVEWTTPTLQAGTENQLTLRIDTNGTTVTKYTHKLAYLWDFRMSTPGDEPMPLELANITAFKERGVVQNRPVYELDAFTAVNNSAWRITDHTNGVLFKYPSRVQHHDVDAHERFVQATCAVAVSVNTECVEVYWANDQWTNDVIGTRANPAFSTYMEATEAYANGTVFWMLDLNLYDRDAGKLTTRATTTSGMEVAVGFAATTAPTPGYYHAWRLVAPFTGTYIISMHSDTNLGVGRVFNTIEVNGDRDHDIDVSSTTTETSYSVQLNKNDRLIIKSELVNGYSGQYCYSEWSLSSTDGTISMHDAHHTSGVSSSSEHMYDEAVAYLLRWHAINHAA